MTQPSSTFSAVNGDGYELQMGRWSRQLAGKFLDFTGLDDNGRILDAGCGTGSLSAELLSRTSRAEIFGVDISAEYIAYASARTDDSRASFDTGDLTSLDYREEMFDQVFSMLVLHFVPDTTSAVAELVRVTKPEGKVSATVWDSRGGFVHYRIFLDTAAMLDASAADLRNRTCTRPMTRPGELANAWKVAGLEDLHAGEVTIRTDFSSFEDYWAPFDGEDGSIPSYLRSISHDLRARIKDAVRLAYLDGENDGPRSYVATAWTISGRKKSGN